jgi:hypothetical protein
MLLLALGTVLIGAAVLVAWRVGSAGEVGAAAAGSAD